MVKKSQNIVYVDHNLMNSINASSEKIHLNAAIYADFLVHFKSRKKITKFEKMKFCAKSCKIRQNQAKSCSLSENDPKMCSLTENDPKMCISRLFRPYSQVPIKRVGPNKRVGWIFIKYFCLSLFLFLSSCFLGAT